MRYLSLCIVPFFLSGCIPIPTPYGPYYKPSYDDPSMMAVRENCHGQSGPESGLTFTIEEGIVVEVQTAYPPGFLHRVKHPFLLKMTVPKGVAIKFLDEKIAVSNAEGTIKAEFPTQVSVQSLAEADTDAVLDVNALMPVLPDTLSDSGQSVQMNLSFWLKDDAYKGFMPEHLELVLPTLRVEESNDIDLEPVVLDAEMYKRDTNYFTSSMRTERMARYQTCLQETPQLHCKNILEVYDSGFKIHKNDINMTGRVRGWDGSIGVGINDMSVTTRHPWKFDRPYIILKDRDNGTRQQRHISVLSLSTPHYQVPMQTPIHAPLGVLRGKTYLSINGSLGDDFKSELEVKLPSLLINEKRYDFKPIKLKLKVLDGEFPPFNC